MTKAKNTQTPKQAGLRQVSKKEFYASRVTQTAVDFFPAAGPEADGTYRTRYMTDGKILAMMEAPKMPAHESATYWLA